MKWFRLPASRNKFWLSGVTLGFGSFFQIGTQGQRYFQWKFEQKLNLKINNQFDRLFMNRLLGIPSLLLIELAKIS